MFLLLQLRYDEIHTTSTAFDPIPNLTRAEVLHNVSRITAFALLYAFVPLTFIVTLNALVWSIVKWVNNTKFITALATACWCIMAVGVLMAGVQCYMKYGH